MGTRRGPVREVERGRFRARPAGSIAVCLDRLRTSNWPLLCLRCRRLPHLMWRRCGTGRRSEPGSARAGRRCMRSASCGPARSRRGCIVPAAVARRWWSICMVAAGRSAGLRARTGSAAGLRTARGLRCLRSTIVSRRSIHGRRPSTMSRHCTLSRARPPPSLARRGDGGVEESAYHRIARLARANED